MKDTKNILLLFFIIALFIPSIKSQELDVFKADNMVFYGLDFSESKFLGGSGQTSMIAMQDKYMPALNELMIDERRRYDVASSYQKKNVEYYFDMANEINAQVNMEEHYNIENAEELSDEQISEAISRYKEEKHNGLGLVYLVSKVNHSNHIISIKIVFFSIKSGEILLVKMASGKMKGFGIRNYYAGGIRQIIKETRKSYPNWKY